MDARSRRNERPDEGANRGLPDILDLPDDRRATPLNHAENRWLFGRQGSLTPRPLQPALPTPPASAGHRCRLSFVAGDDANLVAFPSPDRTGSGWRITTPSRNCSVIRCVSPGSNPNSWVIGVFERFNLMKYRHKIHTESG